MQAWLSKGGIQGAKRAHATPLDSSMNNIGYAYDGRGSIYRGNNKSAGYGFQSRPRRMHGGRQQHHGMPNGTGGMMNSEQMHPQPEPVWPANAYPDKLMSLLKSSGEYDRLRKQIFTTFQNSVSTL
jgi:hypothetical protein